MHTKLRNSLIGLVAVFAFVTGSVLFGTPLSADEPLAPVEPMMSSPEMQLVALLLTAGTQTARASEHAGAALTQNASATGPSATSQTRRPTRHSRQSLGMPYFSFASVLPRAPQES